MTADKESVHTNHTVEEKLNSVTHSIGAGMSIAGMIFLFVLTGLNGGGTIKYVSFSIYGAFQILLYMSSALTHQFSDMPRAHKILRIVDQAAVYLLIAGTYTPVALLALKGRIGWTVFGVVWGVAVLGILSKVLIFRKKNVISDLFYLPMGWIIIFAFKPLISATPMGFVIWAMIGGGSYTVGIIFYLLRKMPFSHVIWHLFVLAGGISFYLGFAFYLV
ncbi:MAG: hemolysin III family protein [Spirochaetales bacterium]|nr:hemolysin III family protein [Spirochaetales bacterium]